MSLGLVVVAVIVIGVVLALATTKVGHIGGAQKPHRALHGLVDPVDRLIKNIGLP